MDDRICSRCGTPMGFMMYGSSHIVNGEWCKAKQSVSHKEQQLKAIKAKAQLISNCASSMLYDGDNLKYGCNQIIDTSNEIIDSIA